MSDRCWSWPLFDGLDLGWVHSDGVVGDDVTLKFHHCFREGALVEAGEVVVFPEDGEHGLEVLGVKSWVF